MGLVKPNQQTFQTLTTIILILKNGTNCSAVEKKHLFDEVKLQFKRHPPQRNPGQIFIANLPESPQQLHALVPMQWWTQVFGKPFGDINWDAYEGQLFDRIASSIAMRNTRTDVRDVVRAPALDQNALMMMAMMQARAGGLARALSGEMDPNITLIHRAGANAPALMPPAQAGALAGALAAGPGAGPLAGAGAFPALMDAGALAGPGAGPQAPAGGGEGAAGGNGAGKVFSTAAGAKNGSGMSLNEVAQNLGAHARGVMKRPAAAKKPLPVSVKKKPAAASTKAGKVDYSKAKRDNGCAKCRGREGCTPSCVRLNTRPYPC